MSVCSASAVVTSFGSAWTGSSASISRRNMPHGWLERMSDHTRKTISLSSMQAPDLGLSLAVYIAGSRSRFVSGCVHLWLCNIVRKAVISIWTFQSIPVKLSMFSAHFEFSDIAYTVIGTMHNCSIYLLFLL